MLNEYDNHKRILNFIFGLENFRHQQYDVIRNTLEGQSTLVILSTGAGKSLTYQFPPFTKSNFFTIVISPLIALAKDQYEKCVEKGIDVEMWNCNVSMSRKDRIASDLSDPDVQTKLLYVTPEGLKQPKLIESLKMAYENKTLCSIAVDEAHCVSEWGHDFRPSYLELASLRTLFPLTPISALTGSCTNEVQKSILKVLGIPNATVIRSSFNRPNIKYEIRYKDVIGSGYDSCVIQDIVNFVRERPDDCGIVYCCLRTTCDWVAAALCASDIEASAYHAGKDQDQRNRCQGEWSSGRLNVVVATVAFGMGIDRANVRWVIHWNAPASMEGFYQESGRAGRDGLPSISILYASVSDLESNQRMEKGTRSGSARDVADFAMAGGCRRRRLIKFFQEDRGPCQAAAAMKLSETGGPREEKCDFCLDPKKVLRTLALLEERELAKRGLGARGKGPGRREGRWDDDVEAEAEAAGKGEHGRRSRGNGCAGKEACVLYPPSSTSPSSTSPSSTSPSSASPSSTSPSPSSTSSSLSSVPSPASSTSSSPPLSPPNARVLFAPPSPLPRLSPSPSPLQRRAPLLLRRLHPTPPPQGSPLPQGHPLPSSAPSSQRPQTPLWSSASTLSHSATCAGGVRDETGAVKEKREAPEKPLVGYGSSPCVEDPENSKKTLPLLRVPQLKRLKRNGEGLKMSDEGARGSGSAKPSGLEKGDGAKTALPVDDGEALLILRGAAERKGRENSGDENDEGRGDQDVGWGEGRKEEEERKSYKGCNKETGGKDGKQARGEAKERFEDKWTFLDPEECNNHPLWNEAENPTLISSRLHAREIGQSLCNDTSHAHGIMLEAGGEALGWNEDDERDFSRKVMDVDGNRNEDDLFAQERQNAMGSPKSVAIPKVARMTKATSIYSPSIKEGSRAYNAPFQAPRRVDKGS